MLDVAECQGQASVTAGRDEIFPCLDEPSGRALSHMNPLEATVGVISRPVI
jgi:hypothetical protein